MSMRGGLRLELRFPLGFCSVMAAVENAFTAYLTNCAPDIPEIKDNEVKSCENVYHTCGVKSTDSIRKPCFWAGDDRVQRVLALFCLLSESVVM
jgi:hypothetical protein